MHSIVQQVERWFGEACPKLSQTFTKVNFLLMHAQDGVRGKVTIQVDGASVGATITFWNKGDVEAIGLDKEKKQEFSFDDRVLTADDDVPSLLKSYFDRLSVLEG